MWYVALWRLWTSGCVIASGDGGRCKRCSAGRSVGQAEEPRRVRVRLPRRRVSVTRRVLCSCSCGLRRPPARAANRSKCFVIRAVRQRCLACEDRTTDPAQGAGSRAGEWARRGIRLGPLGVPKPYAREAGTREGKPPAVRGTDDRRSPVVVRARLWCPVHAQCWTMHA